MDDNILRKALTCLLITGLLLIFFSFSWAKSQRLNEVSNLSAAVQSKPAKKPIHADLDSDGLSDGLQEKLADALPTESIDVIVTFLGPGNAVSAQRAVGPFRVKRKFKIIPGFSANMTAAQAKGLAKKSGVFRVEEDFKVSININAANRDFGTESVRTEFGLSGLDVGICVIDTGVDPNHEQLDNEKIAGFIDYVNGQTGAYDDQGHGTHVSSIAAGDGYNIDNPNAATFKGVAPEADIYAAKALDSLGSGYASDIIAGIEWCAEIEAVDVISMSLASAGSSDGNDSLSKAVNSAVDNGKVVVVAAGNAGAEPYTIGSPAAAQKAITVGAVAEWSAPPEDINHSNGVYILAFSSRGPTADDRVKPDIVAPGSSIAAAKAGSVSLYVIYSGTSMATPFVAGTVALALQNAPSLTPAEVKSMLMSTAQARGPENDLGAGLLDGYAFAAEVLNQNNSGTTPFPTYQSISGYVSDNGEWTRDFQISESDLGIPIGISITIEGEPGCSLSYPFFGCLAWEWSPDLDAELYNPNGELVAESKCPLCCECGNMGRQETVHAMPTMQGTYTVKVKPFADAPNNGKGGNFILDVSTGPVAALGEVCDDGVDNDGNGLTDCEDLDCNSDPYCNDGDEDGVSPFDGDCNDNDAEIYPEAIELCDDKDNDCDDETADGADEIWIGVACDGNDSDLCKYGVYECLAGIQKCNDTVDSEMEICDDYKDNDCDGNFNCMDSDCTNDSACIGDCNNNGNCEQDEDCDTCPNDCISGDLGGICGNSICEPDIGEDCLSCPNDCAGKQGGKPSKRFCCGGGNGTNPVGCNDTRCTGEGFSCSDYQPELYCCGDRVCEGEETVETCAVDCGCTRDLDCNDNETCTVDTCDLGAGKCSYTWPDCGLNDDCCGPDCTDDPDCIVPDCGEKGVVCDIDDDCCSNWCHRGKCK